MIVGNRWCAGGLVGSIDGGARGSVISDSSATGAVRGHIFIGGLIGGIWSQAAPVTVTRSFASGNVTVTALGEGYAGGLVGLLDHEPNSGTAISESFATGDVTYSDPRSDARNNPIGGLVGGSNVSGSVASAGNSISDSYSTGTLTGVGPAGGVAGKNYAGNLTISNSYSRSAVRGPVGAIGPILGYNSSGTPTISDSFWNPTDTDNPDVNTVGTQSTQAAMKTPALYSAASWDIADAPPTTKKWISCAANNGGYPFLRWYGTLQGWTCGAPTPPGPTPPEPTPPETTPPETTLPETTPSNAFVLTPSGSSSSSLRSVITTSGPGVALQRASFSSLTAARSAKRLTACTSSRKITKAGRYTLSCKLTSAARSARRRGALRITLVTTFTPTGGIARTITRVVTLKKTGGGGVTG